MNDFLRIIALGIMGAVLTVLLGKQTKEMGTVLSIACCAVVFLLSFAFLEPVVDFLVKLRLLGGLNKEYTKILFKSAGMCFILEFACGVCEDAGQAALGKTVRICGNAALVYIALPLLEAVVDLLTGLLGG